MALTPERIAELERLKALMQQPADDAKRKAQAIWNAEQMAKPQGKKDGGLEKFLKDSKVKERLYHGTDKSFSKFKPKHGMIFLAPKPDFANDYTTSNLDIVEKRKLSPNVMPVHAHAKNPWDYQNSEHVDALHAGLVAHPQIGPEFATSKGRLSSGDWTAIEDPAIQETIKKLGHDSFYVNEGGYRNLGMYDRRNIKSATGNRGKYDRRSSDITKAQGGTVNAFDYENPEHVSSVAGHVAKHKDFKAYEPKLLGEVLSTGNYKHIEDPRIQGAIKRAGFSGYHTLEKTGKKLTPFVVKKAIGGGVQPSVQQMRDQLTAAGKPLQDISQIGAEEAPNMDVKNFVAPANQQDGQIPVGGVDMSAQQPGQQLLPANMMQPQPNPMQPQQPPAPQAGPQAPLGGNILQMTPQGQKMAALGGSPQGNLPPAPPKMAVGGPVPTQNYPFQSADHKPLPFMAKEGGSDNRPMDNQSMDNGATTFNIDNIQEYAKGGSSKPAKSLHYEPSPSLSKADIEAMAERMARQMSGEDNPNQKTLQQIAREKDLSIGIKGSKKMDVPIINYEDLKNSYSVGVPGDTSRGGVKPTKGKSMGSPKAGEYLTDIGGEKLDQPVGLYGGKDYGAYGHPAGWASDLGASAGMFNVVKKLAEENPEREVYGHYHKMSPEALNHAVHMLDAVISHHKPHASPADRIAFLNDLMRNQKTTTSKHDVPYPEFPGFENPADIMLQGQMNSGMRKKIIGLLGKEKYFPGGKQKLDDIIYAISHPELRNIETGAGGSSIIKFDPSRSLKESISPHPTYGHDIPSSLVGRTRYTTPAELLAPRSMHNAKKEIAAMGKKVVPFNQAKMNIIREPIDEQYINQMGAYEQAMRKRLGYKAGGGVKSAKVTDNLDTMRLALTKNSKKAK